MTVVNQEQKEKTFRIELEGELLDQWGRMLSDRKITQTNACMALIRWIVRQDPLLQALVFEQQPPRAEVLQIIFGAGATFIPMAALAGTKVITTTGTASHAQESSQRSEQGHQPPHSESSGQGDAEGRSGGQKRRPRR